MRWITVSLLVFVSLLSGCSGNGFHLRGGVALPAVYQKVMLEGEAEDSEIAIALQKAFEDVGSELVFIHSNETAVLQLTNYQEGKRVVGYGTKREVREFLIFTSFDYEVRAADGRKVLLPKQNLQADKTQIYDSEFVLGKIEEERLIRDDLRSDLSRQVLIRLRYGYPETENTK